MNTNYIPITSFIKDLRLEVIVEGAEDAKIITSEVNRIGLQIMEYYEYFSEERIQVIGKSEYSYLQKLSEESRYEIATKLMQYKIPCLIFTRELEVFESFKRAARENNCYILRTDKSTTSFNSRALTYTDDKLAEAVTLHGVLVDVYGIGILIIGKSGVGKSEAALELIKRGHRFVGDDAIILRKTRDDRLLGTSPELIKNLLEIRGIGILDISKLYGIGSIRHEKFVDLVVRFEEWDKKKTYDRLGLDENYSEIMGVKVALMEMPVKPGRNLAVILEAAAINHRQKAMGYNAALELEERMKRL